MVLHSCNPSLSGGVAGGSQVWGLPGQRKKERGGDITQVSELLHGSQKVLGFNGCLEWFQFNRKISPSKW
jgi:hypothetical protein